MKNNLLIKILLSIPIILISLYFIPFFGICLVLLRNIIYGNKKRNFTLICITVVGFIILLPKGLSLVLGLTKTDIGTIPYLNDIVNSKFYNIEFVNYSELLIEVGIILLVISCSSKIILSRVGNKLGAGIRKYINESQKRDYEISKQNDMEIKQEKAKNTSYVKCPNCGSDNLIGEKFGTCKYCRQKIENKNFKVK